MPSQQVIAATSQSRPDGRLSNWLRELWRNLSYCWTDPDASPEIAESYRIRQFHTLTHYTLLAGVSCVICALVLIWLFMDTGKPSLLWGWFGAVSAVSAASLYNWMTDKRLTTPDAYRRSTRRSMTIIVSWAILFSTLPTYLFGQVDSASQMIIIAYVTGFIANGALQASRSPSAGIVWCIVMCLGCAATLIFFYGDTYFTLAWLLGVYCLAVCSSVLLASNLYVRSLMAETEAERQRQLLGLLLHDFEGEASDWLWETDSQARLNHVSARLAGLLDAEPQALLGRSLLAVLFEDRNLVNAMQRRSRQQLEAALALHAPFCDIEIEVSRDGEPRLWSLSGKPLIDMHGQVIGWRGVGTDRTAERLRQLAERDLQSSREAAARMAGELDTARRIQMGLLPDLQRCLAGDRRISAAAMLEPAFEVGGDYYECFARDEDRYYFAVADVSGKGVPASLFMAMTKTLLSTLRRDNKDLGDAVSEMSDELSRHNPEMLFVTMFVAILDVERGELQCVSAGHDVPLLHRAGEVSRLELGETYGPPMCALPGYRFETVRMQLLPGDTLCFFTDGATEACNGPLFYGEKRLAESFAAWGREASLQTCVEGLRADIRVFENGRPAMDDLTILALRWHGGTSATA